MSGTMAHGDADNMDIAEVRQPLLAEKPNGEAICKVNGAVATRNNQNGPYRFGVTINQEEVRFIQFLNLEFSNIKNITRSGWTPLLILTGGISILSSALPVGYNIAVINTPANIIKQFCNESVQAHYGVDISNTSLDILWSLIVSILLVGGMAGALSGSILADKFGRKGVTIIINVLGLTAAMLFVLCRYTNSVEILIFSRLLSGLSSGLATATVPMYLTEIAPINLRGAMGVICPLGVTTGVFLGQIMGLDRLLGTEELWHYLLGLYGPLILASVVFIPTLPESPKYLYVVRGQEAKALQELVRIRKQPEEELTEEIQQLRQATKAVEESGGEEWTASRVLRSTELFLPMVLVCTIQAAQQCIGINAVFFYSTTIFEKAGLSLKAAQYANLGTGFINFFFAALAIPLCSFYGRRPLLLMSFFTSSICLAMLGIVIYAIEAAPWVPYLAIVAVYLFVLFFGLGVAPVPYFIGSELFDVGPRPIGMAFGGMANWGGNFLIGMTFPTMFNFMGPSAFFVYAALSFGVAVFLSIYFPETKGVDPADIARMLKDGFNSKIQKKAVPRSL